MVQGLFSYDPRRPSRGKAKWTLALVIVVLIIAGVIRLVDFVKPDKPPTSDVSPVTYDEVIEQQETLVPEPTAQPVIEPPPALDPDNSRATPLQPTTAEIATLPESFNLAVPFTSQAPFGVWDVFHEETCEEASFLMAHAFYEGVTSFDPNEADAVFYDMFAVQNQMGFGYSIDAAQSAAFVNKYYEQEVTIYNDPSPELIKSLVASGKPVIVPAAGRELGNPFFTGEGPLYHMLVIRGYTETTFITNDPGTRHGQNYVYDIDVFMAAIGDWNNGDPVHGAKRVFVIEP